MQDRQREKSWKADNDVYQHGGLKDMMWNEKEAVEEAMSDILYFLSQLRCWPDDIEYELRKYIWEKYKVNDEDWRF